MGSIGAPVQGFCAVAPAPYVKVARSKCRLGTIWAMGTKQQRHFCEKCNTTTNHVTSYSEDESGLVARVNCSEHSDVITQ